MPLPDIKGEAPPHLVGLYEAIANADAHVSNYGMPSYSELLGVLMVLHHKLHQGGLEDDLHLLCDVTGKAEQAVLDLAGSILPH